MTKHKSDVITLEDPSAQSLVDMVVNGNRETRRAFGKMSQLAAKGAIPSAFPIAGGAPNENPAHPFGPPVVSNGDYTVSLYLQQPTRVTRMIMDLTLQKFVADKIFASAGGVTGGAVVYDQAVENETYLDRDVQQVSPGGEFPIVDGKQREPKVAPVEKWGGKVFILDETRDRNDQAGFANKVRQLANTQIRKINQRAIKVLDDSISSTSQTFTGRNWSTVVVGGSSQSNANQFPLRDFAVARQMETEDELGVTYDLAIMNPQEYTQLIIIYGAAGLREILSELGFEIYVTNRQAAGKVKYVAQQQVGEMRVEKPLGTETWREGKTERTWVQSSVRPVMYVTNPYAVLESTGHAG